jgi:ribosomal protein S18 acetylase RimI-like enzyme
MDMNSNIEYKEIKTFGRDELERLFLSVEWSSGRYPERLVQAMQRYETVLSAWDGERLVGMLCAMDDGVMTAYIHYLLVAPEYQHCGIGRRLVEIAKERYADYLKIVLIAYTHGTEFYENCGFHAAHDSVAMYLTEMGD